MNYLKRLFSKKYLRKILIDLNLSNDQSSSVEKTKVSALLLKDGFKICNIKERFTIEELQNRVVKIFNESTHSQYNMITKNGNSIEIYYRDFYKTNKKLSGFHTTDLATYTNIISNFDMKEVNGILMCGVSGSGKTTLVKELIKSSPYTKVAIYTPKEEDYSTVSRERGCELKNFEPENIEDLKNEISMFNNDKNHRAEVDKLVVIDEFLLLTNLNTKDSKVLIEEISKCLAFNRSSRLRFIFITQTLNKAVLNGFNTNICNTLLVNLPELTNYNLGEIPERLKTRLPIGKFLKICHDKSPEILFYEESK